MTSRIFLLTSRILNFKELLIERKVFVYAMVWMITVVFAFVVIVSERRQKIVFRTAAAAHKASIVSGIGDATGK